MEMNQFFMGLVLLVSVIHLAARAGKFAGTLWNKPSHGRIGVRTQSRERDDWYVFFHCADLLGKVTETKTPHANHRNQHTQDALQKSRISPGPRIRARS
jgi:hypothetical protein